MHLWCCKWVCNVNNFWPRTWWATIYIDTAVFINKSTESITISPTTTSKAAKRRQQECSFFASWQSMSEKKSFSFDYQSFLPNTLSAINAPERNSGNRIWWNKIHPCIRTRYYVLLCTASSYPDVILHPNRMKNTEVENFRYWLIDFDWSGWLVEKWL